MARISSLNPRAYIAAVLLVAFVSSAAIASTDTREYPDVTVLSQTDSEILFSYRPVAPSCSVDDATGKGTLSIGRCALNERIGEARIPVRKILIGLPPAGAVTATVVSSQYETAERCQLEINETGSSTPFENAMMQKAKAAASYSILSRSGPYFMRDQRVLELVINPVKIEGTATVVSIAREITVRVTFESGDKSGYVPSYDDGFERIFKASLLNYDYAKAWRAREIGRLSQSTDDVSPFANSDYWLKVGIRETGIYKISRSVFANAGIDVNVIDPRSVRAFWRGGRPLPVDNALPRPEFREIAIRVVGEEDGAFDEDDYVLFYMHDADFIDIDSSMTRPEALRNPYTTESFVWLTYGGSFVNEPKRMAEVSVAPDAETYQLHDRFDQLTRYEEDRMLSVHSGDYTYDYFRWFWQDDHQFSIPIGLEDYAVFQPCSLFVKSFNLSDITIEVDGRPYELIPGYPGNTYKFLVESFRDGSNTIDFNLSTYPPTRTPYLDHVDLVHPRFLRYSTGTLDFYTYNNSGAHRYSIESDVVGVSDVVLLNVLDLDNQVYLSGHQYEDNLLLFDWTTDGLRFERFVLATESQLLAPSSGKLFNSSELLLPTGGDLVIIAPDGFHGALGDYISYRESDGFSINLVSVDDVYNTFSAGMLDPVAIRDFLKHNFENSGNMPMAALLVGDGCYDFRSNLGQQCGNYIPPFIVESDSTISDENYVSFGSKGTIDSDSSWGTDRGVDMVIARWPVRSSSEISSYTSKLETYEDSDSFGPWRNLITLVADDEFKSGHSQSQEAIHTIQSETLSAEHMPSHVNVQKIYLTEYPFDSFGQKPRARSRVIEAFNDGTALINYIGHGNPDLWADERVFYWKEDLFKLTNKERLAVVVNASCSIGQFDSPLREGMAEELFRYAAGGAIGTIAATRLSFSGPNAELMYKIFDLLLGEEDYTLCEAVYVAKLLRQISIGYPTANDRSYVVFADPLMDFGIPEKAVTISSVEPSTLSALELTEVRGYVSNGNGSIDPEFSGDVYVTVYDAERKKEKVLDRNSVLSYTLPGPRVYRGKSTVANGEFDVSFIVPKDIAYGETSAKISAYALSSTAQAAGGIDSIEISGSNPSIVDTIGPGIEVRFASGAALDGEVVNQGDLLLVEISDSSGINLSGEIGHGIQLSFDDDPLNSVDLTEEFAYYPGSYRFGFVEYEVPSLSTGPHIMKVKAWDSANNSGLRIYNIAVGELAGLALTGVVNYPNPATTETRFSYHLSEPVSDVRIEVFSLSGRLIKTLRGQSSDAGYNMSDFWDITDDRGDRIANGVYIYKITASGRLIFAAEGEQNSTEGFGKIVVLR